MNSDASASGERSLDCASVLRLGDEAGMAKAHAPSDPVVDHVNAATPGPFSVRVTEFLN